MSDEHNIPYGQTVRCGGVTGLNEPMPSREELLASNSFGGPDNNPYLTTAAQRAAHKAKQKLYKAQQEAMAKRWGMK